MSNRYENKKYLTKNDLIISRLQDIDVNLRTLTKGCTFAKIQQLYQAVKIH